MRIDPSSKLKQISVPTDYSDHQPDGIAGFTPTTDGTISFVSENGEVLADIPVQAGNPPPWRGKINFTAINGTTLIIGL